MKKLIAIIFAGIAIVALLIFFAFQMSSAVLSPLYSDLSPEDLNVITARLTGMNMKHEVINNKEVKVASDKVLMLRMMFAQEGIPSQGNIVGYEVFDKETTLGTSQFIYNINLVRALEGELARTISSINQIDNVRVHIVLPKKELFSRVDTDPSASVVLKMKGNQILSKLEIAGISNLVATAVPGLKIENITIIDNLGRPLKLGAEEQDSTSITSTAIEFQHNMETRLKREIEELVERSVGVGKVKATVAAEIDFDREVIKSEEYDPDKQVVRSRKISEEREEEGNKNGIVGVSGNLPNTQPVVAGTNRDRNRTDEVVNYEISKTVTSKVIENGRIKKLSIAVLIDGIYELDGKTGAVNYKARDPAEIDKLKNLIISGVGLNTRRGDSIEVVNMRFAPDFASIPAQKDMLDFIKNDLQNIVQTIVIGIVLVLTTLLVIRPIVLRAIERVQENTFKHKTESPISNLQQEVANGFTKGNGIKIGERQNRFEESETIDLTSAEDRKKLNLIKNFNTLVEKHPEETVSVIRNWLYKE